MILSKTAQFEIYPSGGSTGLRLERKFVRIPKIATEIEQFGPPAGWEKLD
jgi:hypothetical protein